MEIRGRGYTKVLLLLLLDGKRHTYNVEMSERFLLFNVPFFFLLFIMFRIHDRMVFYDRFLFANR